MRKSKQSFAKREREKKKALKKKEKQQKKKERRENAKDKSADDMLAYIDEFGNLTSVPPGTSKE